MGIMTESALNDTHTSFLGKEGRREGRKKSKNSMDRTSLGQFAQDPTCFQNSIPLFISGHEGKISDV